MRKPGYLTKRLLITSGITLAISLSAVMGCVAQDTRTAQANKSSAAIAEIQRLLDEEVARTPSLPGELLHVHAPGPGIDRSFAAGLFDRETKQPLDPHHVFRVASVTKTFIAAAVLRLHEEGKLRVDDPVARYLPREYVEPLDAGGYSTKQITLRHLLTHASGIYDYAMDQNFHQAVRGDPKHRWTRMEQTRFALEHGKPYFAPGAGFHYADTNYILLGEIVERVSHKDLAKALRTLLNFKELGLDETWLETLEPPPPGVKPLSHSYWGPLDTAGFDPSFDLYGGGGIVSSVEDLARFFRGLFTGRVFRKPETLQLMQEIPEVNRTGNRTYAMGIFPLKAAATEDCWGTHRVLGNDGVSLPKDRFNDRPPVQPGTAGEVQRE
ncbi:MAG TPA: serine hydrolase domain-containing protein [Blastocatellia bacterium]|nr:serine hydrolase domain-containing protein [Blastocatellia bacterium]